MKLKLVKNIYLKIFFTIILLASINVNLDNLDNTFNISNIINFIRITAPFIISFFIILLSFKKQIFDFKNSDYIFIYFFYILIIYISQIAEFKTFFKNENLYLILGILLLINQFIKLSEKEKELHFIILIFALSMISIFFSIHLIKDYFNNYNAYWLYNAQNISDSLMNASLPRITGLSRMISIVTIFLIYLLFFKTFSKFNKFLIIFFIFLFTTLIWGAQSRGTFLCSILSIFFLFIFCNKKKFFLIFIISLIFTSVISFNFIAKNKFLFNAKSQLNANSQLKEDIFNNSEFNKIKKNRILINPQNENIGYSSGRFLIWGKLKENFEFNRKFFGYGPQADRFLLKDERQTFTNSSNAFIYSFICGGYLGLLFFVYFYLSLTKTFLQNIYYYFFNRYYKNENVIYLSILPFFLLRCFFENSISLFSLDLLICLSCYKNIKK